MEDFSYKPIVYDKQYVDSLVESLGNDPLLAQTVMAQATVADLVEQNPELFQSYESMRAGTAPFYLLTEKTASAKPADRALNDIQILRAFVVNPSGEPAREGDLLESFKESLPKEGGRAAGFRAGMAAGAKLGAPIPPANPIAIAAKTLVFPFVGGVIGSELGAEGVDELYRSLVDEDVVIPGVGTASEKAGNTAALAAAFALTPYSISKNIDLGSAGYIKRTDDIYNAVVNKTNFPMKGVTKREIDRALRTEGKGERSARVSRFVENLTSKMGEGARQRPIMTAIHEAGAGAGATGFVYGASQELEGDNPLLEATAEVAGSVAGSLGAGMAVRTGQGLYSVATNLDKLKPVFTEFGQRFQTGGIKKAFYLDRMLDKMGLGENREVVAARIRKLIETAGEDPEEVIQRLSEAGRLLRDENGNPIPLTAGAKSGSPALMLLETELANASEGFATRQSAMSDDAIQAYRGLILSLADSTDGQALQSAAEALQTLFEAGLAGRLSSQNDRVLSAFERTRPDVSQLPPSKRVADGEMTQEQYDALSDNEKISIALFEIADRNLRLARAKERQLWEGLPDYEIRISEEQIPEFIQVYRDLLVGPIEVDNAIIQAGGPALKALIDYSRRISQEAGLEARPDSPAGRAYQQGDDVPSWQETLAEVEASPDLLRSIPKQDLVRLRSLANGAVRTLEAENKGDQARIVGDFARALLNDLENGVTEEAMRLPYQVARSYSRALNDVYTRAFAGDILRTDRTGANRKQPENLLGELIRGGNDPTLQRIRDIQRIGQFAAEEGLEGAVVGPPTRATVSNMHDIHTVLEMMLRSARATARDPNVDGKVNQQELARWMNQNSPILDLFPSLRQDLENLDTAQTLLNNTTERQKDLTKRINSSVTFSNLLPARKGQRATPVSTAVGEALAKKSSGKQTRVASLNNLAKVALTAPEASRQQAIDGLRRGILDYAFIQAGASGAGAGQFKPSVAFNRLFERSVEGTSTGINLSEYMLQKGLMTKEQNDSLRKMLGEMIKFEAAGKQGKLDDVIREAGPIYDLFLRLAGSEAGAQSSRIFGGGGDLISRGAGVRAFRNQLGGIPLMLQMKVYQDLIEDPKLLAAFMSKAANEDSSSKFGQIITNYLAEQGFNIPRRAAPFAVEESLEEETPKPPPPVQESPLAMTTPRPTEPLVQLPPLPQIQGAPQQARPNPQQRMQYAALFPEDEASQMIRGGIGSLG